MKTYIQPPPFTVKVELVQGCNLRCSFCGMNGIRGPAGKDDRYFYMADTIAKRIASEMQRLEWRSRIEMTLHGEPTLNPDAAKIVSVFRQYLPDTSIMMTSNGGGLLRRPGPVARVKELFDAGLNALCLDDYRDVNIIPKIREALRGSNYPLPFEMYEYPDDGGASNPYRRLPSNTKMVTFFQDLTETTAAKKSARSNLSNHAGAAAPLNDRMKGKRCARPFRELAIRYDGRLYLCCDAWRDRTKIGSVIDTPLDVLWQSPVLNAYRKLLYYGQRTMGECKGCDSKSWRVGLLPDAAGKDSLPAPTRKDLDIIRAAIAGPTMTPLVAREWET